MFSHSWDGRDRQLIKEIYLILFFLTQNIVTSSKISLFFFFCILITCSMSSWFCLLCIHWPVNQFEIVIVHESSYYEAALSVDVFDSSPRFNLEYICSVKWQFKGKVRVHGALGGGRDGWVNGQTLITALCVVKGGQRPEEDMEVARAGQELNQEVNRLMVAMRDMLANIRFQEPPREDNPYRDEEEWDWDRIHMCSSSNLFNPLWVQ